MPWRMRWVFVFPRCRLRLSASLAPSAETLPTFDHTEAMKSFQYATVSSPAGARELLGENGRYLAGGIDLLGEMKEYIAQPAVLVNVKSLPGLDKIEANDKAWVLGANVTVGQLEDHSELKRVFPGLQQAAA